MCVLVNLTDSDERWHGMESAGTGTGPCGATKSIATVFPISEGELSMHIEACMHLVQSNLVLVVY